MKKFWKNMCVGALAVTSALGLSGCGKDDANVSKDLDNDNVISEWETLFESMSPSDRVMTTNIVEVSSLDDLKAINNDTEIKVYKLTKNIDCKGETLSINLKNSSFYGNNKVISNFKLGECALAADGQTVVANEKANALFYNGIAIYDLRLFMGLQDVMFDDAISSHVISPFVNVPIIDSVTVKGKISVNRKLVNGLNNSSVDISLLASSTQMQGSEISIHKCSVIGDIFVDDNNSYTSSHIGGIIPFAKQNDVIYDCSVNCEINTITTGDVYTGLVAGESDGFVTTVSTTGSIQTSFKANPDAFVGGVVGKNNKFAEIKNSSTNATISFSQEYLQSESDYIAGGIAGRNDGVISYATSDAILNINNCTKAYLGGIAGYGEHAIYYNIICRGAINPTNVRTLFISDMVGYSKYGYFETAVVNTNITVDNKSVDSKVYLGLVTIFENLDSSVNTNAKFNAEFTPNFKGIVIGGTTNVYMKTALSSEDFRYNLGLRNEYEYYVLDPETGDIVQVPDYNPDGSEKRDPDSGELITKDQTGILLPYVFDNLQLLNTYKLNKYKVTDQSQEEPETNLELTYAKDGGGGTYVEKCDSSRIKQLSFFVSELGFKYGLGHNEIDLFSFDLNKIKFTLSKDQHLERYFRYISQKYNGELSSFDKEFSGLCNYDTSNEMFSFLNSLIATKTSYYSPIKVSKEFAKTIFVENEVEDDHEEDDEIFEDDEDDLPTDPEGEEDLPSSPAEEEDEEEVGDYLTLPQRFGDNVKQLLKLMGINSFVKEYTVYFEEIDNEDEEVQIVKYVDIAFKDANYTYTFTFDVTEMINDIDSQQSEYILYLEYKKVAN